MDSSPACEQNCCGTEHEPRRGDPMIQHTITLCNERCFLQWGEETTRLLLSISLGPLRLGQGSRRKHGHQPGGQSASCTTNFFYRIADRAVKHCRSSRSTTHGGMVKNPLTLAKQGNKQTQTPQTKKQSQTQTQPNTDQRQVSGEG